MVSGFPREPVNTLTHAAGVMLAFPATYLLWRRAGADTAMRMAVLVYGLSLMFCYSASTLIHGLPQPLEQLGAFDRLDRIGIFILIAGTYTPIALSLLRGRWQVATLGLVWLVTVVAGTMLAINGPFPPLVTTALYLGMGWGAVACMVEMACAVPIQRLLWLVVGGVCYSVGALINLRRWPTIWPGWIGPHELFHLFVLAGSAAHFWLMFTVVVPHDRTSARRR